jgi:hypothetical protein
MRKRIVSAASGGSSVAGQAWLDVGRHAQVEVTSEDPAYPVDSALRPGAGPGWRAAESGEQTIRLRFDEPHRIERMRLVFDERDTARTQEFVLRWSSDGGLTYRDVLRQQYTFSPPDTAREVEDYRVELDGVTALELQIVPDIDSGGAPASLSEWTVA